MPMADYLSLPALSQEPVRLINDQCAAAAHFASHLNPNKPADDTDGTDAGTTAHAILLEGSEACLAIIDPVDHPNATKGKFDAEPALPKGWTNKSMREARDAARAAGKIPMLPGKLDSIRAQVAVAREFIESCRVSEPAIWRAFQPDGGRSEVTMVWREDGGTLCRARPDRIANDNGVIVDYKGSAGSVEPDRWGRVVLPDYSVGAAWYQRGVQMLTGVKPSYIYLAQECEPPYLCALIGCDPARLELAHQRVEAGLRKWQTCERLGRWPGYEPRVYYPEMAPWEMARWLERQGIACDAQGIPYDVAKLFERTDQ
jgi:hypothetical protein